MAAARNLAWTRAVMDAEAPAVGRGGAGRRHRACYDALRS